MTRLMTRPSTGAWLALLMVAASGCQQSGNKANETAAANASNSAAPATATPPPATPPAPAPAAAPETGPVSLASDSSLPAPCQQYVRLVQACLDHQRGNPATDAGASFANESLRMGLRSSRETRALAADDTYRSRICAGHVSDFAQHQRTLGIEC